MDVPQKKTARKAKPKQETKENQSSAKILTNEETDESKNSVITFTSSPEDENTTRRPHLKMNQPVDNLTENVNFWKNVFYTNDVWFYSQK